MLNISSVLCVALLLVTAGCSRETLQRTGYETLQNLEDQRCQKDWSAECRPRESYDSYRRDRRELQQGD